MYPVHVLVLIVLRINSDVILGTSVLSAKMHIAVEGCSHGELDTIYNSISRLEEIHGFKVDLLLCCGDFQSVRNEQDLKCMACPIKYMHMHDFYR